jgi:multidrug efflux system outer membrane protein
VERSFYFNEVVLRAFGGASPQLSELTGTGNAWSLAGNLAGPLFTAGRLKNEYRASLAVRDEARISFEKAVTQAFGEVSTSLSAHQQLAKAYEEQLNSAASYRESVRLSLIRYDSGLSSYFEVVDAQVQLYPVESASVNYDLGRKLALVDLYRALGGGWNLSDAQWTSSSGIASGTQTPNP